MPETYLPRKLPRNKDYPGYQFYCTLQMQECDAEACFCFAVLCVIDWLKERLRETNAIPAQISRLPGREDFHEICAGDLESFTIHSGFSASVVSLPRHGIWTLRLKEHDSDTDTRKAVPGRFFATNVGLRIRNDRQAELGIRIDVTEPEEAEEVEFAFRPKLLRYLFEAEGMILTQVAALPYQKAIAVETDEQLKLLRTILDSAEGTMPLILITEAIRLPGKPNASMSEGSPLLPFRSNPIPALFPSPAAPKPLIEYYDPFDADDIASHNFGYAITCRISEKMHDPLAKRLKKDYTPGDILFVEPKRFGGNVRVMGKDENAVVKQAWKRAHCYSKDRKYSFGDVQFEFDARNVENRELINRIRASTGMETEEKLDRLNQKIDELQKENEKRVQKITELKEQLLSEFKRGEAAEKLRTEQLFEDFDRQEEELRSVKARNMQLERENQDARALQSAVETFRNMSELPNTNGEVIHYFRTVFGNRLAFTERGIRTGCKSDIRAEGLWYYLYQMATTLFEIHHCGKPDVEGEFLHASGIEVAMGEGSQTNKGGKFRKMREDVYEGKDIYVAPHVKLEAQRTGAENRRIYYCYDRELDRIIIGWIGMHLDTAGTMHMN